MPSRIPTHRPRLLPTKAQARRVYDRAPDRAEQKRFYCSARWKKLRLAFLAEHPLCNRCPADRPAAARDVHHVKPRDVRPDLAFDPDNLEGLCVACHKRTRDEDRKQRRTA